MSSGGGGFFNRLNLWGAGGGGAAGGHQGGGPGRGGNHPRPQGPGGGQRGVSFEDSSEYDFSDDDRYLYGGNQYPLRSSFSEAEYEARQNSIFHPDGAPPTNNDARGSMPPPENAWHGHQSAGLHPTMNFRGLTANRGKNKRGRGNKARVSTRLWPPQGHKANRGNHSFPALPGEGRCL